MSRLSTVMLACLLPMSAFAAPATYVMDPLHSYPNFTVSHLGMSTIHGRFDKMTGTITLDQAAKTGSLEAKIASASVSTGDAKHADGTRARDEHLRSADFFNSAGSVFPNRWQRPVFRLRNSTSAGENSSGSIL